MSAFCILFGTTIKSYLAFSSLILALTFLIIIGDAFNLANITLELLYKSKSLQVFRS
jgi:hypothetical protein